MQLLCVIGLIFDCNCLPLILANLPHSSCAVSSGGTTEHPLCEAKITPAHFRAVNFLNAKLWQILCIKYHLPP